MKNQKGISKPLPCQQEWDRMTPAEAGRICQKCNNLVTDFRDSKWNDIKKSHLNKDHPVCGIYNPKQLSNWEKKLNNNTENYFSSSIFKAIFVGMLELFYFEVKAQTKTRPNTVNIKSREQFRKADEKILSGKVFLVLNDSSRIPVSYMTIKLIENNFQCETVTDKEGNFEMDISENWQSFPDSISLWVGNENLQYRKELISKHNLKDIQITYYELLEQRVFIREDIEATSYYARSPINEIPIKKRHWWQFRLHKK